jgi:hypothetical protein
VLGRLPQGYNLEYALADEVVKFLTLLDEFSSFILASFRLFAPRFKSEIKSGGFLWCIYTVVVYSLCAG